MRYVTVIHRFGDEEFEFDLVDGKGDQHGPLSPLLSPDVPPNCLDLLPAPNSLLAKRFGFSW
ncbi:MAG: hypothetical protein KC588_10835 [Nitrospira sp.]|nr:hypothetical protein [Nitrospira sp.]